MLSADVSTVPANVARWIGNRSQPGLDRCAITRNNTKHQLASSSEIRSAMPTGADRFTRSKPVLSSYLHRMIQKPIFEHLQRGPNRASHARNSVFNFLVRRSRRRYLEITMLGRFACRQGVTPYFSIKAEKVGSLRLFSIS